MSLLNHKKQVDQTISLSPVERMMFKKTWKRDKHHKTPVERTGFVGPFIHTNGCSIYTYYPRRPQLMVLKFSSELQMDDGKLVDHVGGYTKGTPLKINMEHNHGGLVWKIIFLSKWVICRFHVNLPGCTQFHLPTIDFQMLCYFRGGW